MVWVEVVELVVALGPLGDLDPPPLDLGAHPRRRGAADHVAAGELGGDRQALGEVDVELRQDMWNLVRSLQDSGVTIILTTHYIEEAEEMADRVGVISKGEIILVEDKDVLMQKLGKKQMTIILDEPITEIPGSLAAYNLAVASDGQEVIYTYDTHAEYTGITSLLAELNRNGIMFHDLHTTQSSLEDIFVGLVSNNA